MKSNRLDNKSILLFRIRFLTFPQGGNRKEGLNVFGLIDFEYAMTKLNNNNTSS